MKETTILTFDSTTSTDIAVLEIDPHLNKDAEGNSKSSFELGESIYLSLHYDKSKYRVSNFVTTTGDLRFYGIQQSYRDLEQQLLQELTTSIPYIVSGINSITWYGPVKLLTYSYSNITVSEVPCIVDINISIVSDIYIYVPDSYVNLDNADNFPVGVIFDLEEI